jgi:hypothetical protein
MMMVMCTINHCRAKIGVKDYTLNFFVSTDTVGQPYLRDVAHEQTLIAIIMRAKPASSLFFIVERIFTLTVKRTVYFVKISQFF